MELKPFKLSQALKYIRGNITDATSYNLRIDKTRLCLLSELQIFDAGMSQSGQSINRELLPALYW